VCAISIIHERLTDSAHRLEADSAKAHEAVESGLLIGNAVITIA
jgi:hypothetical protein